MNNAANCRTIPSPADIQAMPSSKAGITGAAASLAKMPPQMICSAHGYFWDGEFPAPIVSSQFRHERIFFMKVNRPTADRRETPAGEDDFDRYRGEELFGSIARLVILPRYATRFLLLPVLLAMAPVVIGGLYLTVQGRTRDALLFLLIGALLALINGFLVGIVYLLRILADDLKRLTGLSSRISLQILEDRSRSKSGAGELPPFSEIARSSIITVILPGVVRTIKSKMPLLGGFITIFAVAALHRFAGVAARLLSTREKEEPEVSGSGSNGSGRDQYLEAGRKTLSHALSSAGARVESGLRKASFPFKILLAIVLPVSILVLISLLRQGA
jgi:hypothetical protein